MTKHKQKTTKDTKTRKATARAAAKKVPPPGPGEIQLKIERVGSAVVERINVPAETVGEFFAVHAPYSKEVGVTRPGFDLTHIPTGRRVAHYRKRRTAVWAGEQLRALAGAEVWDFTDMKESPSRVAPFRLRVLELTDDTKAEPLAKGEPRPPSPIATKRQIKTVVAACTSATGKHAWSADATVCLVCKLPCPTRIAAALKAVATRRRNEAAVAPPPPPAPIERVEQFVARGVAAQKAVDAILPRPAKKTNTPKPSARRKAVH